jgi:hypothetical protein
MNVSGAPLARGLAILALLGFFASFQYLRSVEPAPPHDCSPRAETAPASAQDVSSGQGEQAPPKFHQTPQFFVWSVLLAGQIGLWIVVASVLGILLWGLRQRFKDSVSMLWPAVVGLMLLGAILLTLRGAGVMDVRPIGSIIGPYRPIVQRATEVGLVVALPGLIGIWSIQSILRALRKRAAGFRSTWSAGHLKLTSELTHLRSVLQRFLTGLGAMVAALALATGALRNAIVACTQQPNNFPPEYVVLYSLGLSAILALVYLPVYGSLEQTGFALLEKSFPLSDQEPPSQQWVEGRNRLINHLQLGTRAGESLRAGAAILAPLSATLLSLLIPGAK